MATDVDICNAALSNVGDSATVSSINPPENSRQAELCALHYPQAVIALQELFYWSFTIRRVKLSALTANWSEWDFAYALPSDCISPIAIHPPMASDDQAQGVNAMQFGRPQLLAGEYVPQPFIVESDENGNDVIYTDVDEAILQYTVSITDSSKFSPLFTEGVIWMLASKLAGSIIKGSEGAAEAKRCLQMANSFVTLAKENDANSRRLPARHIVGWIAGR